MRIVHLPLDSRPCNALFPVQLAQWCGHACVIPPAHEMDHFRKTADFQSSSLFVQREGENADALVIAVDHWCYGSLLGSRSDEVTRQQALDRLDVLAEWCRQHPQLKVYAYSVIMRSSVSTLYASDLHDYNAMTDYSVYSDRAAQTGDAEDVRKAQQARDSITPSVLMRYQLARERNHAVNARCVEFAAQGIFHSLALLQEDAQTYGFHKGEQRRLLDLCARLHVNNVWLHNGADEGGAITVMKAIAETVPAQKIAVRCLGWENAAFTACYEDRPFGENVRSMVDYIGFQQTDDARYVLAVCCPPDGIQKDWPQLAHNEGLQHQAEDIAAWVREGKQVYALDVTRANGGSPELLRRIHRQLSGMKIAGYSAWNTASNALGTALAQMMSDMLAQKGNRAFLWERILDDLAYQGMARATLNEALTAAGEDTFCLANRKAAEELLRKQMLDLCRQEEMFAQVPAYHIRLPWERTFEAEINVSENIANL